VNGEAKDKKKVKTPRRLDFFGLLMQASRCAASIEFKARPGSLRGFNFAYLPSPRIVRTSGQRSKPLDLFLEIALVFRRACLGACSAALRIS
jgi:hypothetical protein